MLNVTYCTENCYFYCAVDGMQAEDVVNALKEGICFCVEEGATFLFPFEEFKKIIGQVIVTKPLKPEGEPLFHVDCYLSKKLLAIVNPKRFQVKKFVNLYIKVNKKAYPADTIVFMGSDRAKCRAVYGAIDAFLYEQNIDHNAF